MANTTDIMITSFFDEDAIEFINKKTNLDFKKITDGSLSGGSKNVAFDAYAACHRCIGKDKIDHLIKVFKKAPFERPEYAILLIDDDNEVFEGVVRAQEN